MPSTSIRWYALSTRSASVESPAAACGRPAVAAAQDPAEQRDPADRVVGLQQPVALDAAVHLGADAQLVAQPHLEPAGDAARGHPGVEQLVGAAQEEVERLGRVALLERAVDELRAVPGRRRHLEAILAAPARRAASSPG